MLDDRKISICNLIQDVDIELNGCSSARMITEDA